MERTKMMTKNNETVHSDGSTMSRRGCLWCFWSASKKDPPGESLKLKNAWSTNGAPQTRTFC